MPTSPPSAFSGPPRSRRLSVTGLGYVGLPVATAFARAGWDVTGFDTDARRVAELQAGHDRTGEVDPQDLERDGLRLSSDPACLGDADFHIITVPTPVSDAKRPDLGPLLSATRTVGTHLKPGGVVVYESTVYPGCTEQDCVPVLEAASGLWLGRDFGVGYSPERINPGDRQHRFETITKIVSGSCPAVLDLVAAVYGSVVQAGIHRAPSIAVAEAAKVIENTQRDLNIALMNELSMVFRRLNIDTHDVLAAAGTKWNFLPFVPGLVGGHCIGVDPYYLTHRAEQTGYHPDVILAGRRINDSMGAFIARETIRHLGRAGVAAPVVTILGLTFKEDIPDIRNTRVTDVVDELGSFGAVVQCHDPMADPADIARVLGRPAVKNLSDLTPADAVVLAVPHRPYRERGWGGIAPLLRGGRGLVVDVKAVLDRAARPADVALWRP